MADYSLLSDDTLMGGSRVVVEKLDLESLDGVLEVVLNFLQATGFTYVKQLVAVYDDGNEVNTQ